jgi:Kef-type K+ transport system membrane component KefB
MSDGIPQVAFLLAADNLQLPLSMLIVFASAKLLAELFEAFHQPGIVGEILAGVLIGPSVLNWIQPNELLHALSEVGVIFLLFRVGLEVKSSEMLKVGGTALVVAVLGIVLPFAAGWAIMRLWGEPNVVAIFTGTAMVATSVGITAQVLAAKGVLQHRASQIILAAAVIDDVLGLIVLAIVSSFAKGGINVLGILVTAVLASGFTVVVALWGARAMGRVVPRVQARLRVGEVQFNFAIITLFSLSVLAIRAGVAAIVGAFLAGMALAESIEDRVRDLAHGVTELLVPFFLAYIGMNLNLDVFRNPATLALSLIVLAAAVLTKWIGCGLGAWSLGRADMLRIGCGMVPRGEVGMVVAQLGLSMGVIPQHVYAVAVFMAVATTIVAPPLLNLTYRDVLPTEAPAEDFRLG